MIKRKISLLLAAMLAVCLAGCAGERAEDPNATDILLSGDSVEVEGEKAGEDASEAVYLSRDIIYYEDKDTYESGDAYGEGTEEERHSADEAAEHTVVNITSPGTYRLSGELPKGQIRVDLGEEAADDPAAVVTLILDGVDVNCSVAPAILFLNVYECDGEWSVETASSEVDTSAAGANIVIADGSKNTVNGSHVARIYKDGGEEKKLWKQDGAVYSYMSMNVDGETEGTGTFDITADNEGLDTELHLTVNGGNINIRSQNDGINTNEDGVSVTAINGGNLHIIAGLGEEGDGVDSNGWLVVNGGTVIASANPAADAGLDSDMGSYINGGFVAAFGSTMDWAESDSGQVTMNLQFSDYKNSGDAVVVMDEENAVIFAYDPSEDEVLGSNTRRYMGAVISSPEFKTEETYKVYIGGTVDGTEIAGVYDVESINAYVDGRQQAYTGTDVMMGGRGPGGFGGGQRPQDGELPEMPEDWNGEIPEGMERPQLPDGEQPQMPGDMEPPENFEGERPQRPEGEMPEDMELPENGEAPGERVPGMNGGEAGGQQTLFYMQDKVNFFSGVSDADETASEDGEDEELTL